MITWERLLVIWGLLAPAIAWLATRRWERALQREHWEREARRREADNHRRDRERQRRARHQMRLAQQESMKRSYAQFLESSGSLILSFSLRGSAERQALFDTAFPAFSQSYHELLLFASNHTARPASEVWKVVNCLASGRGCPERFEQLMETAREERTKFAHEARKDLENPRRISNPAITVEPVVQAGGFKVPDVG